MCNPVEQKLFKASSPNALYRQGESVIFSANNEERTGRINAIHSFTTNDESGRASVHIFSEVQLYEQVTDGNGQLKYHPGTQSQYLRLSGTLKMVNVGQVLRKVILYPDEACSLPQRLDRLSDAIFTS